MRNNVFINRLTKALSTIFYRCIHFIDGKQMSESVFEGIGDEAVVDSYHVSSIMPNCGAKKQGTQAA